ncbi:putative lambdoid prophage Rac integrase [Escherichia coli]|nr:putative lambdoid prophage Rac integrase [Escherichia coli]KGM78813.1 putative lambdoid prophage Rac integrase [Escherichia coli]KGM81803.1 putative lambdoid prophage Rac integrase [Escherichia coli]
MVTLLQTALEALKEQYKLIGHHRKSEITFYHREDGRTEKQKLHFSCPRCVTENRNLY